MDSNELQDVRAILAARGFAGGAPYEYYEDRYALRLLRWATEGRRAGSAHVRDLKRSQFSPLLAKPRVAALLARAARGIVTPDLLDRYDGAHDARRYDLTLGTWGWEDTRAPQTSRCGANLVLQLNFDRRHAEVYERLVKPRRRDPPFEFWGHPVSRNRKTLAWARIDLDLRSGEALIEEIQSDWLRGARWARRRARANLTDGLHRLGWREIRGSARQVCRYYDAHLWPHVDDWSEAMLLAALWLVRDLLGIRHVFFHTPASGSVLKEMNDCDPPRSIYTDLPRRFCFREAFAFPSFVVREWADRREKLPVVPMHELVL